MYHIPDGSKFRKKFFFSSKITFCINFYDFFLKKNIYSCREFNTLQNWGVIRYILFIKKKLQSTLAIILFSIKLYNENFEF
jgi:hypothetical protein